MGVWLVCVAMEIVDTEGKKRRKKKEGLSGVL